MSDHREGYQAPRRPCAECPWRPDVPTGRFSQESFRRLAGTSYDVARTVFACHMSAEGKPMMCAGFLARGAGHNLTVRLAYARGDLQFLDRAEGVELYSSYRAMAVANGLDADDPALAPSREP